MLFSSKENAICWLYSIFIWDLHKKRAVKDCQKLVQVSVNIKHLSFS